MTMAYTILVVDDEPPMLRMMQAHLEAREYSVITAMDGEEALACLEKGGIDMVFTDFSMPGMDGIELLKKIKERHPNIPVVMMTGYASQINLEECMNAGAEDYIAKPFDGETLDTIVRRIITKIERLKFMFSAGHFDLGAEGEGELDNPLDGNW
ncbi:MAG: response regulator [Planctomycetes bacterium]|nr:response regulator [Planctomycetota bacterium]